MPAKCHTVWETQEEVEEEEEKADQGEATAVEIRPGGGADTHETELAEMFWIRQTRVHILA